MRDRLLGRLREAGTFGEVGAVVCGHAREVLGSEQTVVAAFSSFPRLATIADDVPFGFSAAQRRWYVDEHPIDPPLERMLQIHCAVDDDEPWATLDFMNRIGYRGPALHMRVQPLVGCCGLAGYIRTGHDRVLSSGLRRDLDVLAAYASAHLARLGLTEASDDVLHVLTPREREVAELAAQGLSNQEIADSAGKTLNTVKKQLKSVFDRLGVFNRVELAVRLSRTARRNQANAPARIGNVSITSAYQSEPSRRVHRRS